MKKPFIIIFLSAILINSYILDAAAISPINPINSNHETDLLDENYNDDVMTYMRNIQKTIKAKWAPPKSEESYSVKVLYKIKKDGTIFDIKIGNSSGNEECDKAAIKAIKDVKKLPPLPSQLKKHPYVSINFTFDYNVREKE